MQDTFAERDAQSPTKTAAPAGPRRPRSAARLLGRRTGPDRLRQRLRRPRDAPLRHALAQRQPDRRTFAGASTTRRFLLQSTGKGGRP